MVFLLTTKIVVTYTFICDNRTHFGRQSQTAGEVFIEEANEISLTDLKVYLDLDWVGFASFYPRENSIFF